MNVFLPPLLLGETKRRVARLTTHSCVIAGLDPAIHSIGLSQLMVAEWMPGSCLREAKLRFGAGRQVRA